MRRLLIACGISGRLVLFIVLLFVAGSGECEAILVFTTPLGVAEFTARLNEAMPETTGQAWSDSTTDSLYALLDLPPEPSSREPIPMMHWDAKANGTGVNFYNTGSTLAARRQQAPPYDIDGGPRPYGRGSNFCEKLGFWSRCARHFQEVGVPPGGVTPGGVTPPAVPVSS